MVDDLIRRKLIDGMTRSEVVQLLGKPDSSSSLSVEYTVDIGAQFVSAPWPYQLSIQLDEAGRVKLYCLHD